MVYRILVRCAAIALPLLFVSCGVGAPGGGGPSSSSGPSTTALPPSKLKTGFNLYSPQQDIEMGRQSANQIAQQMQVINDPQIVGYIRQLGGKLAARAPGEKFPYQFNVVGDRSINAFALPGGFIFVHLGAIAAARNEGELAGVMAHEVMHVALRHGTTQATRAYIAKAGLGVLSTIAAGSRSLTGSVLQQLGGTGANMLFLKFGRQAEQQSDVQGARIMAEAGYDPRDMAGFFKTLQDQGGQRTPEFMSDHPDPGNRIASINAMLPQLPVSSNPVRDTQEFQTVKGRVTGRAPSLPAKHLARVGPSDPTRIPPDVRPAPPSSSFSGFQSEDGSFALEHPSNWKVSRLGEGNYVIAPDGAFAVADGSALVTYGIFIGVLPPLGRDVASATNALLQRQIQDNPDFQVVQQPQPINFGGRPGYSSVVRGPSNASGVLESDTTFTTATSDGKLFYVITIVPETDVSTYQSAFERIIQSLKLRG